MKRLLLPGLFLSLLFRWEGAQVRMWGQMLADRSAESGLAEAFASTFSGEAPCAMCLQLTAEKAEAAEENLLAPEAPFTGVWVLPCASIPLPPHPGSLWFHTPVPDRYLSPPRTPEPPPPRSLPMT